MNHLALLDYKKVKELKSHNVTASDGFYRIYSAAEEESKSFNLKRLLSLQNFFGINE